MTLNFSRDVPVLHHIQHITQRDSYRDVPDDWIIALTDVRGSTAAIAAGRYKEVNALAAATIAALLNIAEDVDIPFVFGGDGASVLLPPSLDEAARSALLATRDLAHEQFDLDLRIGIVPVRVVLDAGYAIRVTRLHMSENFQQAIVTGGGLTYAESLLKDPAEAWTIADQPDYSADFSGFECRWERIPAARDETLNLMVMALQEPHEPIYADVLRQIDSIFGDSSTRHPIDIRHMNMALSPGGLEIEAKVRHQDTSWRRRFRMLRGSLKAWFAMTFNLFGWGRYKQILVGATDHEKFDDTLRMTIAATVGQRDALIETLEAQYRAGKLVYGVQTSPYALVTCIVFDYFGEQVHFVDGFDGGYALAAKDMKERLQHRAASG